MKKTLEVEPDRALFLSMVADTVLIDFRLQIASCDCNISPSAVIQGRTTTR